MLFFFQLYCSTALLTFIAITCRVSIAQVEYTEDDDALFQFDGFGEPYYETPLEQMKHKSGADVKLKCRCDGDKHQRTTIWEFRHCNHNSIDMNCKNFYNDIHKYPSDDVSNKSPWKLLQPHSVHPYKRKKCRLKLANLTRNDAGLYRCVANERVLKSFELEVQEPGKYESDPPKVLSIHPDNFTLSQNSHLIIQCNASSTTPLRIWWFKQTDRQQDHSEIKYFNKYYIPINNSERFYVQPETNVYLSKLSIYNVRETDSGVYACAALSNSGLDYKMAVVKVVALSGPWYADWEPHTSFLLLFLIPVLLALIPVTVWLCYYKKKRKCLRKNGEGHQQERKLIRSSALNNNEVL